MRTSGLFFSLGLLVAAPAAAQTPLISLAPPPVPIYGPKTVVPAHLACTDVPVVAYQAPALRVLAPHGDDAHEFSYRDGVVVLTGGKPEGLEPGHRFYTRRLTPPRAGEYAEAGTGAIHTSGWLTVIASDENSALARVDYACDAVMAGDFVEPYVEPALPKDVAPARGQIDFTNMGRVLQGTDRHELFGAGDFVSIDRGSNQGLRAGTRVGFYRDRLDGTPLVELGTGIVLEVTEATAKVVLDNVRFVVVSDDYWAIRQP